MAQMKEQNHPPLQKNKTNWRQPACQMEFKTLVIRMFREFIEYGKSIREEMKATLCEKSTWNQE